VPAGLPIPHAARTLEEFLLELKDAVEVKRLNKRPIEFVFDEASFLLSCEGDWMEFGVAEGASPTLTLFMTCNPLGPLCLSG
jgi:hypothetical protein